jgi:hypothetical protein
VAIYNSAGDRFVPFSGIAGARIHAISPAEPDGTVWLALGQRDRTPFQIRIARLQPGDNLSLFDGKSNLFENIFVPVHEFQFVYRQHHRAREQGS